MVGPVRSWFVPLALASLLAGCDVPARSKLEPATTRVERTEKVREPVKIDRTITGPDGTRTTETELQGPVRELEQSASSKGAGAEASGDKLSDTINTTAPTTSIPGGPAASGGDTRRAAVAEVDKKLQARGCLVAGVIAALLAVGALWIGLRRVAVILGAMAGLLIAMALWPVFMLWGLLAGNVVQAIAHVVEGRSAKVWKEAVRAWEAAVGDRTVPDAERKAWLDRVKSHADARDRDALRKVRIQDGLDR